jgi:exodeoxyribonuclease V alpha subunit
MNSLLQRLARDGDISWLSYYFADFICNRDGAAIDSLLAHSAALVSEANLAGNVCVELEHFGGRALFTGSHGDDPRMPHGLPPGEWCAALASSCCVGTGGQPAPLIVEANRLYLNRYWYYEHRVAQKILAMLARNRVTDGARLEPGVRMLFANQQDADEDQASAVRAAASRAFSVISGGPGSGKTSTVIRILSILLTQNPGYRIALAAPTGKAAARMMDSIRQRLESLQVDSAIKAALPLEARTIHRLLGYRHQGFSYDANRRLPVDCVVIDEASMIDLKLMYQLLEALPDHAQLILLGDRDQLASVAAGNVLGDITGHGHRGDTGAQSIAAATSLLRSSYRFGHDSAIGELAQQVRFGEATAAIELLRAARPGLQWFADAPLLDDLQVDADALAWICEAYQPIFTSDTAAQALAVYERTRLLCATNRGPLGVDTLNAKLSRLLLTRNHRPQADLFAGLPIMITRNFQELGLFNGDVGMLWSFGSELRACFRGADDAIRDFAINRLPEFRPAWASTVHKSQGSEFDSVLLLLPADAHAEVLTRELVYTGITRARREFLLQALPAVLTQAISRLTRRHSGLASKLGWPGT